ncbi:hypothetical protein MMC10_000043 [Thelotrema lepadinum]|nr:hypothetical protein [Thelotrema lepadinum]
MCEYCHWNTLEIGVQFERPSNIQSQLARILSGKQGSAQTKRTTEIELESVSGSGDQLLPSRTDPELQFQAIVSYYKAELEKERPNDPLLSASSGVNFNSPSSLQRIVALYMNQGTSGKKTSTKPMFMRGSVDAGEGLVPINAATEEAAIDKLRGLGLDGTTTAEQRVNQVHNPRFLDELRPLPVLLRTKRSRRCRTCRHILVRPEQKISNPRYRIKLVAFNNIPTMNIKPLATSTDLAFDFTAMPHSRPLQLLLTLRNPLFDKVKVTLGTPTQTSGRLSSRVTILCPQFEIGANTDVWDEALGDGKRSSRLMTKGIKSEDAGEGKVAEAGKIWERGRNWTTVVMEIVCARIECPDDELKEDEDVLEIPIFVRLEYEADAAGRAAQAEKEKQEKRDLAYWTVLGVGKIARSPNITTKAP